MIKRFRSLPIRSRLALLVAAAVAFGVAAVSVTCWFIVQGKLYDQVDASFDNFNTRLNSADVAALLTGCTQTIDDTSGSDQLRANNFYMQLITSNGKTCVVPGSPGVMETTGQDKTVAAHPDPSIRTFHDSSDTEGHDVRVMTVPAMVGPGRPYPEVALMIGVSLKDTQKTLNDLALILLLVSGIGVVGAGATGLWVARAGLRPVDKLTEAVEHVARTEDLTIRIPVEEDSEDEIARLSRSFNSMTTSLANSREVQQQLIADAGHELRTPLTSLRTNIELLARSEETGRAIPPADRKALLSSVTAQMTELAALIGDLQTLSRSDAGQSGDRVQVVALQDTVDAALRRARLRGPELTISADLQPWFVRAEPSALERAIVNILDNAVKFSPEAGTIEVSLNEGVLTVRDHGPGIPADELPHVFDRFWRSPSARALPGSGLGLSIVARTVQQSGGEISLTPAEGGGTLAAIRLPGAPTAPPALD